MRKQKETKVDFITEKNLKRAFVSDDQKAAFDVESLDIKERAVQKINELTPEEYVKAQFSKEPVKIPKWKKRKFERDSTAALSAEYIRGLIMRGTINRRDRENFKFVNPFAYSKMALELYNDFVNKKLKLKYSQKIALGIFLDMDLTGLTGGVFNVNTESSEPIQSVNKEVEKKIRYLKKGGFGGGIDAQTQSAASIRYSSI